MKRFLQGAQVPEWTTKRKTTLIQKDPHKQLQTHNVPTYDVVETVQIWDEIILANKSWIVPWWTKRMSQRIYKD